MWDWYFLVSTSPGVLRSAFEGLEIPYSSQIDITPEGEKIGSHKFFSKFLRLPIAILYINVMHQPNGIRKLKKKAALQHSRSEKLEIKNSNIYLQFIEMLPGARFSNLFQVYHVSSNLLFNLLSISLLFVHCKASLYRHLYLIYIYIYIYIYIKE
jgi:hypothetical protein